MVRRFNLSSQSRHFTKLLSDALARSPRRFKSYMSGSCEALEGRTLLSTAAYQLTDLSSFTGTNGSTPTGDLLLDANGSLFGTTLSSGVNGPGTVFEVPCSTGVVTPIAFCNLPTGNWALTSGVRADSAGDLFVVGQSASQDFGAVFEIEKGTNTVNPLTFLTLKASPPSVLVDSSNNVYGIVPLGQAGPLGAVFKSPPNFTGTSSIYLSGVPLGDLTIDASGNIFGTTSVGGPNNLGSPAYCSRTCQVPCRFSRVSLMS